MAVSASGGVGRHSTYLYHALSSYLQGIKKAIGSHDPTYGVQVVYSGL